MSQLFAKSTFFLQNKYPVICSFSCTSTSFNWSISHFFPHWYSPFNKVFVLNFECLVYPPTFSTLKVSFSLALTEDYIYHHSKHWWKRTICTETQGDLHALSIKILELLLTVFWPVMYHFILLHWVDFFSLHIKVSFLHHFLARWPCVHSL